MEIENIVEICETCPSIKRRGHWYQVDYALLEEVKQVTDTANVYCKPECLAEGTGLPLAEAKVQYEAQLQYELR